MVRRGGSLGATASPALWPLPLLLIFPLRLLIAQNPRSVENEAKTESEFAAACKRTEESEAAVPKAREKREQMEEKAEATVKLAESAVEAQNLAQEESAKASHVTAEAVKKVWRHFARRSPRLRLRCRHRRLSALPPLSHTPFPTPSPTPLLTGQRACREGRRGVAGGDGRQAPSGSGHHASQRGRRSGGECRGEPCEAREHGGAEGGGGAVRGKEELRAPGVHIVHSSEITQRRAHLSLCADDPPPALVS